MDVATESPDAMSEAMIAWPMLTSRIATASVPRRVRRVWANVFKARSEVAFQKSRLNNIVLSVAVGNYSLSLRKIFWREERQSKTPPI